MLRAPEYNEELLDYPLWHVELSERRACVAENAEGTFLVLFTSPSRAYDFIERQALGAGDPAAPTLYSISRDEFMARAERSAAGGARGVVVDPQSDGGIGSIIEFQVQAGEGPEKQHLA
jgi:hypothetical protein